MKIAFYSPLKSPNHPVPSGDRLMARLLIRALQLGGHDVEVVSELRSFQREPVGEGQDSLKLAAERERERIAAAWQRDGTPDVWFCYHPYYKARDLLGPSLCQSFGVTYVTAEASYSPKRNGMGWEAIQTELLADLRSAAVHICFTERDRQGLLNAEPLLQSALLPPFIDTALFEQTTPSPIRYRMATVAMMRAGDKLSSYRALSQALQHLPEDCPWSLDIMGDGPERETVHGLFDSFDHERIIWHGEQTPENIATILSRASLYVWPGHGEAYGLAYLEAQAAGLPVVAERVAGVPAVVTSGKTGLLTGPGNTEAYADALRLLMKDETLRLEMAATARHFAVSERSLGSAAAALDAIIKSLPGKTS